MERELLEGLSSYRISLAEVGALLSEDPSDAELLKARKWKLLPMRCALTDVYLRSTCTPHPAQLRNELRTLIREAEDAVSETQPTTLKKDMRAAKGGATAVAAQSLTNPRALQSSAEGEPSDARPVRSRPNPRMHPRNLYAAAEPDFAVLADADERFHHYARPASGGRVTVDFIDPNACRRRELTRALLKHDFGIEWWVADGQLIPPVTNRMNYIHWLQDLLQLSHPPESTTVGLDIGCGANLIYCLLGAAVAGWHMVGVDVTAEARSGAERNLALNPNLRGLIKLRLRDDASQGILRPAVEDDDRLAFSMCNPPFFSTPEEAGRNPATAFQGTAAEMVWPGGELAFVTGMVKDSLALKDRIYWYTTMVGKKGTLKAVRQELFRLPVTAVRVTEFAQGKTSRWGLAWSFAEAAKHSSETPLQRDAPADAPLVIKRQTTFSLHSRRVPPGRLLARLAQHLEAHDSQCRVDEAAFSLVADVPLSQQEAEPSNSPPAKKPRLPAMPAKGSFKILASIVTERQGQYTVRAKIPLQSQEGAAEFFTALMHSAEAALREAAAA